MNGKSFTIFTDGASRSNPGPAAIAAVFYQNGARIGEYGKFIGTATNNEAEYQAIILALQKAKSLKAKRIEFFLDSELAVKHLNHEYKIKDEKIIPLFIKVWNLTLDFDKITFTHIPREKNKEADKLVNKVLDAETAQKNLL
jgi:ribonuclease HI